MLGVFCPFAAGYFLSFFFRNVNAVISKDLAREFSLSSSDLGFLTSMYLLAFAAFQLPLGVLLDRYGPRRVVAALLCIAAAGALTFALARDFAALSIGRALIGLGVSGGLMGAIKAFTLSFPLSRLATLNGLYLAVGGIGGLSATAPAEVLVGPFGWRVLFIALAALSVLAASAVFFIVPEKRLPGEGQTLRAQIAGFGEVFTHVPFWRIALPLVVCHAGYLALQGLWLGPWLYDVAGESRVAVGVKSGLGVILAGYGFTAISAALAYAIFTPLFPPEMTGRVNTASNVLMFACSFVFQWGIGALLRLYPVQDGRYAPEGYSTAFLIIAALQAAALAWLLPMREVRQPRL